MTPLVTTTALCKALSEPLRLRVVLLLREAGELCVCDLMRILDAGQSMVSRHLAYLRNAGLVASRREGLWMHYRLAVEGDPYRSGLLELLYQYHQTDPQVRADRIRLQEDALPAVEGCAPGQCLTQGGSC